MSRSGVICIVLVLILGLPLLGVVLAGDSVWRYLEFPPRTSYIEHEPFSWTVFIALALLIALVVGAILIRIVHTNRHRASLFLQHAGRSFPWWGWLGIGWTGLWWVLAWTRFPWMAPLQEHTFTPLWLGYIVIVNACTFACTGRCMMLYRPRYFLSLFPLSAAFWWVFEYLNRFVQNWYYVGFGEPSLMKYVVLAAMSFSTVLPAVIGTAELLTSFSSPVVRTNRVNAQSEDPSKSVSWALFILACLGLLGIGLWPNYLFPLVWVGPLLLIVSLESLAGRHTVLSSLVQGDWRGVWVPALAALNCGFFWELWNWKSLAHWEYVIPFVHRFQLFEMPLLGYTGYLPFGLECVAVANLCLSRQFSGGVEYYSSRS